MKDSRLVLSIVYGCLSLIEAGVGVIFCTHLISMAIVFALVVATVAASIMLFVDYRKYPVINDDGYYDKMYGHGGYYEE